MLVACENPLDCIVDDRPVLNTEYLEQPILNQVFESVITVSIKNNPDDREFYYDWTLIGDLPPGISYGASDRTLAFSGTATALGTYPYSVRVYVSDDDIWRDADAPDASSLCRQEVRRDYMMVVAPM